LRYRAPFVNLPAHWEALKDEILPVLEDVLSRGQLIMREELSEFENELASFCGARFAVGLNSCTDGMMLALKAAGIGPGDEVITVAHTFVATLAAIVHNGAKPVLVDVSLDDHLMQVEAVQRAITPRTRAVIPVHLNGRLCQMEALTELCNVHGLTMIEDAAQALGASLNKGNAGTFGLAGSFSLYPMKMLGAFGDGGALVTDDEEIYRQVCFLRDHGQDRAAGEVVRYGFNSRLDNVQAAVLSIKLKHLPEWIDRRRALASRYEGGLTNVPEIVTPAVTETGSQRFDVFQNYVIRTELRDELAKHLEEQQVETLVSWPVPLHHNRALGLQGFHLPNTEELSRTVLSLPMNPDVTDQGADYTIDAIRSFFGRG